MSDDTATPLPQFSADWEKNVPYTFNGITLIIEYLAGDVRRKVKGGVTIETVMPTAYGEILNTTDVHGEKVDMYINGMFDFDDPVFVVDQIDPSTGLFDEHKVMLGFASREAAIHLYTNVFADGSGEKRLGAITSFSPAAFDKWIKAGERLLLPASNYTAEDVTSLTVAGVRSSGNNAAHGRRDNAGGVHIKLEDMSKGPVIKTLSNSNNGYSYHLYFHSCLDMVRWTNVVDTFCRILDLADSVDEMHIHIASPGGSVSLLGRMVSSMNRTKAKVFTYAEGCVASAATSIWAAGHERHILPGAFFMQHMSSQMLAGETTDIAAKSVFSMNYIESKLKKLADIGLFTIEEVSDMVEKSADIYISGREAISRVGAVSTND